MQTQFNPNTQAESATSSQTCLCSHSLSKLGAEGCFPQAEASPSASLADLSCESMVKKIPEQPGTTVPEKIHQVQESLRGLPKFLLGKCLLTSFPLWSGKDCGRLWREQFQFDLEGGFEHNSVEQLSYCTCSLRKAGPRLAT